MAAVNDVLVDRSGFHNSDCRSKCVLMCEVKWAQCVRWWWGGGASVGCDARLILAARSFVCGLVIVISCDVFVV